MKFTLIRYSDVKEFGGSTQGLLMSEQGFFCHTLEDEGRDVKVKGETRIPAGLYELKIRKEETPLTIKHRQTYGAWFRFHLEITNVQGFSGIYIHAGNTEGHTDGCLLLGEIQGNNTIGAAALQNSIAAVKRFYEIVYPLVESGNKIFLEVRDKI